MSSEFKFERPAALVAVLKSLHSMITVVVLLLPLDWSSIILIIARFTVEQFPGSEFKSKSEFESVSESKSASKCSINPFHVLGIGKWRATD